MADFLGFAASAGMLALIGCLAALFLRETGALSPRALKNLLHAFLMAAGVGAAYFLVAALICQLHRQEIGSPALIAQIFSGACTKRVFEAIQSPAWIGPLSTPFVYAAHGLGALLFGQYELAGIALAFLMTVLSGTLLLGRLGALLGEKRARDLLFLLLCLPFGVFLFLPGWPPLLLLIGSIAFSLLGRRIAPRKEKSQPPAYGLILALSTVLSAFVLTGAVSGWIG